VVRKEAFIKELEKMFYRQVDKFTRKDLYKRDERLFIVEKQNINENPRGHEHELFCHNECYGEEELLYDVLSDVLSDDNVLSNDNDVNSDDYDTELESQ
jgi:hypothetical protein